ncbi:Protein of unknown function [Gryllus bimaculatus]|nr:Protein of unknown function [Gryllus bimaculatus]
MERIGKDSCSGAAARGLAGAAQLLWLLRRLRAPGSAGGGRRAATRAARARLPARPPARRGVARRRARPPPGDPAALRFRRPLPRRYRHTPPPHGHTSLTHAEGEAPRPIVPFVTERRSRANPPHGED